MGSGNSKIETNTETNILNDNNYSLLNVNDIRTVLENVTSTNNKCIATATNEFDNNFSNLNANGDFNFDQNIKQKSMTSMDCLTDTNIKNDFKNQLAAIVESKIKNNTDTDISNKLLSKISSESLALGGSDKSDVKNTEINIKTLTNVDIKKITKNYIDMKFNNDTINKCVTTSKNNINNKINNANANNININQNIEQTAEVIAKCIFKTSNGTTISNTSISNNKNTTESTTKNKTANDISSEMKQTGIIGDSGRAVANMLDKLLPWNSPIGAIVCGIIVVVMIMKMLNNKNKIK